VILVVLKQGETVGAVCYGSGDGQICCIPDREDDKSLAFLSLIKRQLQPTLILTSTKADEDFVQAAKKVELGGCPVARSLAYYWTTSLASNINTGVSAS
jgi:hypothetical protein